MRGSRSATSVSAPGRPTLYSPKAIPESYFSFDWPKASSSGRYATPTAHPPARRGRERSAPTFSSALIFGASGCAARFVRSVRFAGVEGSLRRPACRVYRAPHRTLLLIPRAPGRFIRLECAHRLIIFC